MGESSEKQYDGYLDYRAATEPTSSEDRIPEHLDSGGHSSSDSDSVPHTTFGLPEVLSYCLSSDLTTLLYCSSNVADVLGCPLHQIQTNGALLLRHVHADDRFRVLNTLEEALLTKTPASVAYRWIAPDTGQTSLLFNHCAAAHSDQGQVISGVIVHIDHTLSKEISLISGFGLDRDEQLDDPVHSARVLLDESLEPLSPLPKSESEEAARGSPLTVALSKLLADNSHHSLLKQLRERANKAEKGSASENIFSGAQVLRATLRKITRDTFTPYFHLTITNVSDEFLEREELRSLRKTQSSISALRDMISPLDAKLQRIEKTALAQLPSGSGHLSQLSQQARLLLKEIRKAVESENIKPFINGGQLVMRTLNELASQLPSSVRMQVEIPSQHIWIWSSIAQQVDRRLAQVGSWILSFASQIEVLTVSLESAAESHAFTLRISAQIRESARDTVPSEPPTLDGSGVGLETHAIESSFSKVLEGGRTAYQVNLCSTGCFISPE